MKFPTRIYVRLVNLESYKEGLLADSDIDQVGEIGATVEAAVYKLESLVTVSTASKIDFKPLKKRS